MFSSSATQTRHHKTGFGPLNPKIPSQLQTESRRSLLCFEEKILQDLKCWLSKENLFSFITSNNAQETNTDSIIIVTENS